MIVMVPSGLKIYEYMIGKITNSPFKIHCVTICKLWNLNLGLNFWSGSILEHRSGLARSSVFKFLVEVIGHFMSEGFDNQILWRKGLMLV